MLARVVLILVAFGGALFAQDSSGYVFFAPGGITAGGHTAMTLHFGGGGEGILGKGIGLGLELGALGPRSDLSESIGVFSPNGYFHFSRSRGQKSDPFVTAGYTLFFRHGTANLWNFGGGANYWFSEKIGLRVEMRDHVWSARYGTAHYWGVRAGLSFRSGG